MFIRKEAREEVADFAGLLDYFGLVEDGIAFLTTGAFLAAWEVEGMDADSLSPLQQFWHANRVANGFNEQLGADFGLSCDLIRQPTSTYAPVCRHWPDPISALIEAERREQFTKPGNYWTNRTFVCLWYRPVPSKRKKMQNWFFGEAGETQEWGERSLRRFQKTVSGFEQMLRSEWRRSRRLQCSTQEGQQYDELFRFIRFAIQGEDFPFLLPEEPVFLNQLLSDDFVGGAQPKIGNQFIATLAIDGFPQHSFSGILSGLDALPFPYRFSQQAEILDTQQAVDLHQANAKAWSFKSRSMSQRAQKDYTITDSIAAELGAEAAQAQKEAEYRRTVDLYYTGKVVLLEEDPHILQQRVKLVQEALRPFRSRLEDQNAVAAWISSLPGQLYKDRRQNVLSTQNLAHFLPLSSPYQGLRSNPSRYLPPQTPPVFYAATKGATHYRFHPHVEDVGHGFMTGPTGNGKTSFLALLIAQWFRFPDAQVFAFDKRKSLYTLAHAMGADYYDLSPDVDPQFCPCASLETPSERAWAVKYLAFLCEMNSLVIDAKKRKSIERAVERLQHTSSRSLTDVQSQIDDAHVAEALDFYTIGSANGGMLDGVQDQLRLSRFCVFEMDELYRLDQRIVNGVLFYLFHRITKRAHSSRPTLVTGDEFREALSHPVAAKGFEDFLCEGRKINMAVWVAMQEIRKVLTSPLKSVILGQCKTKVLLPNPDALGEEADAYEALGTTLADREQIAGGTPKRDYYHLSPDGRRMISLDLGKVFLALLDSNDTDRPQVDALRAQYGPRWVVEWLRRKGLEAHGWPQFLEKQLKEEAHAYAEA